MTIDDLFLEEVRRRLPDVDVVARRAPVDTGRRVDPRVARDEADAIDTLAVETLAERWGAFFPGESAPDDLRLFCSRCWRTEYHFLSVKARGRYAYRLWRYWTLGLVDLVGTFRCRCCGHQRFWRFDLFRSGRGERRGGRRQATEHSRRAAALPDDGTSRLNDRADLA